MASFILEVTWKNVREKHSDQGINKGDTAPKAIRVNILRLRVFTDCHPRLKKGHPSQSTMGAERMTCSHWA